MFMAQKKTESEEQYITEGKGDVTFKYFKYGRLKLYCDGARSYKYTK